MAGRAGSGGRTTGWLDGSLVGRDELIGDLVRAAEDTRRGAGTVVLLTGDAGSGKTSVGRVLARRVRDELAVSWGTCAADQSAPPFWPWRTVVGTASTRADERNHARDFAIG